MRAIRVIITGSRDFDDEAAMRYCIQDLKNWYEPLTIVHGGARGADAMAERICSELGIPTEVHMADWKAYGKAAGAIRNKKMLDSGVDMVVAFKYDPDLTLKTGGTENMVRIARKAGVHAWFVRL